MPEGDTLFRTAETLRKALRGRTVQRFVTTVPHVAQIAQANPVSGWEITAVEARGKHLLIVMRDPEPPDPLLAEDIDVPPGINLELKRGDMVLHTHLRMTGSWHIYRPGEAWRKPVGYAKVVLYTDAFVAPCFSAPVVELLSARETARHPQLVSLGPDAMTDAFNPDEAFNKLRSHPDVPVGVALMNQRAMSGVGNVFKSEVMFIRRVCPFSFVREIPDDTLRGLIAVSHVLLQLNAVRGHRQTRFTLNSRERLWVYGRNGEQCRVCHSIIKMRRQGLDGRSTYYCPQCQNVDLTRPSFES